jgi:alkylated DNA repair dioxygenase AlkB
MRAQDVTSRQAKLPLKDDIIPGLEFVSDLITEAEERTLVSRLEQLELPHFVFQRWISRRRTKSFGYVYDFKDSRFSASDPIPAFLHPLRDLAATFANVSALSLVQASVIKYEPGAGIGWHIERPELSTVVGISFNSATVMRFRRRLAKGYLRSNQLLPPRSAYHLTGEVREVWEHSILPGEQLRWSVTFRGLSDQGTDRLKQSGSLAEQHETALLAESFA